MIIIRLSRDLRYSEYLTGAHGLYMIYTVWTYRIYPLLPPVTTFGTAELRQWLQQQEVRSPLGADSPMKAMDMEE